MKNQCFKLPDNNKHDVYLLSLGGAETVTGSKHLLMTPGLNVLIDCGLFQGLKSLRQKNREAPAVNPDLINAVIITHAHIDHCGYIPLLVKYGYTGKIYMSGPTSEMAEVILRESAMLQEEDAQKANQHGYSQHKPAKPLYTVADVEAALPYFTIVDKEQLYPLNDHVQFRLHPAGHIPGACSVEMLCYQRKIVFSGDIGRYNSQILPPPSHPAAADIVVMESTYGDHLHENYNISERMAFIINEAMLDGGNILIPCCAAGRAQEVMLLLSALKSSKQIPASIPVFFDSPLAATLDNFFLKYPGWVTIGSEQIKGIFSGVTLNDDARNTKKIVRENCCKIVLAGDDVMSGGRIMEYLKQDITGFRNSIVIVGYQPAGTRGRGLLDGVHELKIHGKYYAAKAHIAEIKSMSAHADQAELLRWLSEFTDKKPRVYLAHGEPAVQQALRIKVKDELNLESETLKQDNLIRLFSTIPEMASL